MQYIILTHSIRESSTSENLVQIFFKLRRALFIDLLATFVNDLIDIGFLSA